MMPAKPDIAWPGDAREPNGSTLLTADEIIAGGGGAALRRYVATRLTAVAIEDKTLPQRWASFAVQHLTDQVADGTNGGVEVAAASVQMVLAYIAHLEQAVAQGGAA
jgi:hypothetical protein